MIENHVFFGGSAVAAVSVGGTVRLPRFVRDALCRGTAGQIIVGAHQADACLVCYPRAHVENLLRDLDRRRVEEGSSNPDGHYRRARRIFGFAHELSVSPEGRLVLPPPLRRRAGIDRVALFVGIGRKAEIWSLDQALKAADANVRALAAAHGREGEAR